MVLSSISSVLASWNNVDQIRRCWLGHVVIARHHACVKCSQSRMTSSAPPVSIATYQPAVTPSIGMNAVSFEVPKRVWESTSSSSYNFSDALHMRSIMHCCWRGVRG